jgi:formamidopyrimidine-DNA glycosylase
VPELPEVEYILRRLQPVMQGARIRRVRARRPNLRYPLGTDFVARVEGQTVVALKRRAKYLVAELSSGDVLLMHLGMSGWFRVLRDGREHVRRVTYYDPGGLEAHDHVVFEMSSGAAVVFNDPRRFGFMKVMPREAFANHPTLLALGPEPLDPAFDAGVLSQVLRKRKTSLKVALSDQRIVAGLGNIYVCEALHRAAISPKRAAGSLVTRRGEPRPELHRLVQAIKAALKHAIAHQHRADSDGRFRVYDREGLRCSRRGCTGIVRRIVQAGRSTFYCPVCQH